MQSEPLRFVRSRVGVAVAAVSTLAVLGYIATLGAQEKPADKTVVAQAPAPAAPATASAPQRNPERNAYFGETHVHTSWSLDAFSIGNVTTTPADAYKYFKGEPIKHPLGYDVKIDTPLDWAGVTDHSEYAGVVQLANEPGSPVSKIPAAQPLTLKARTKEEMTRVALYAINVLIAGPPVKALMSPEIAGSVWKRNVDIADQANEPGKFTAFCSYEWTSMPNNMNLHRNVFSFSFAAMAAAAAAFALSAVAASAFALSAAAVSGFWLQAIKDTATSAATSARRSGFGFKACLPVAHGWLAICRRVDAGRPIAIVMAPARRGDRGAR